MIEHDRCKWEVIICFKRSNLTVLHSNYKKTDWSMGQLYCCLVTMLLIIKRIANVYWCWLNTIAVGSMIGRMKFFRLVSLNSMWIRLREEDIDSEFTTTTNSWGSITFSVTLLKKVLRFSTLKSYLMVIEAYVSLVSELLSTNVLKEESKFSSRLQLVLDIYKKAYRIW